jgi:hypothetical protein
MDGTVKNCEKNIEMKNKKMEKKLLLKENR